LQNGFPVYVYDNGENNISFCEPKGDVVECFFGRESGLSEGVYSVVINAINRANKTNKIKYIHLHNLLYITIY
jgi:hypothetical protein